MARVLLLFILFTGALTACRQAAPTGQSNPTPVSSGDVDSTPESAATVAEAAPASTDTPAPTPTITPTPMPPKDLIVCLGSEPTDLYLYGDDSAAAVAVRNALYESPYTSLNYDYQALALEKLPNLADGDAILETVDATEGMVVVNADEQITPLTRGMEVVNAAGERVAFDGEPIPMSRLVVDFTFKPLVWSDGTPVTAEDSVYSFQVAGDRATPRLDSQVRYTADYAAVDERTVRWTGLPGYLDPAYMTHVWAPLPAHQLADFAAAELPALDETARAPLSYGAFVVESWTPGESIRLTPNPNYYRAKEGLPNLTSLTFRFLSTGNTTLPAGYEGCHILTQDVLSFDALPALDEAAAGNELVEYVATAGAMEQVIFGIDSAADYESTHVPWFQDPRVRQAVTQCTDRQAIVDELTFGRAEVMDTFVPNDHTLHPDDVAQWAYDPAAANALLDEAGFIDNTGDGIRDNIASTVPFSITLGTNSESDLRRQITQMIQEDLAECGIQVNPYTLEAGAWFAPGPDGAVFGRGFDLAQFAWLNRIQPECGLYLTEHIPGPLDGGFNGWQGINVSGWSNEEYDAACRAALLLLPGQPGYAEAHQEAMRIFARELPAMPLFTRMRLAATTPDVLNFRLDPTQPSELWNAHELDLLLDGS